MDDSLVADLRKFTGNLTVTYESMKMLDGFWKLRYTSKKFRTGYRGAPKVIMFVNSTSRMTFVEVSYPKNQRSLRKVLLKLTDPSLAPTKLIATAITSENGSITADGSNQWRFKLKSIELVREPLIKLFSKLPFVRFTSFSAALAVPPLAALTKQMLKQIFPSLCALSPFKITYLDDDVCVQQSVDTDGKLEDSTVYNVFTRVYEAWDPMEGWVLVSTV